MAQKSETKTKEVDDDKPAIITFDESRYPKYKTGSFSDDEDCVADLPIPHMGPIDFEKQAENFEKQAKLLEQMAENAKMAQVTGIPPGMPPPGMLPGGMPMVMPGMPHVNPMMMMPGMPWCGPGMMPGMPGVPMGGYAGSGTAGASGSHADSKGKTTVMWKNLPNNYTRDDLLALIDAAGFAGTYDFFYSPIDFTSNALVGYAFINCVSTEAADKFYYHFQDFTAWTLKSEKVSVVTWSHPLQGLDGHIERYRNSPVMHEDVSDDKRPVLFKDGVRIPFPEPTKKLRAPHLKDCRPQQA